MILTQFSLQMNKQVEIEKVLGDVKSEKAILLRAKVSFSVQDIKGRMDGAYAFFRFLVFL